MGDKEREGERQTEIDRQIERWKRNLFLVQKGKGYINRIRK